MSGKSNRDLQRRVGNVCFQEVARLVSTADIGRVAVDVRRPSEWPLSQLRRREAVGQESTDNERNSKIVGRVEAVIRTASDDRPMSDLGSLSEQQRVLNIDAEISDSVLDLGVTEQDLDGAEITRRLIDH
jgi:hypothetical protein